MSRHSLAIHEAGHAVVGIAFGWGPQLVRVSIASEEGRFGSCVWRFNPDDSDTTDEAAAVAFAGPIAQTLYSPESLGPDYEALLSSINKAPDELLQRGLLGWFGSHGGDGDLRFYMRREKWKHHETFRQLQPATPLEVIEERTRRLLSRADFEVSVRTLAQLLYEQTESSGTSTEVLVGFCLRPKQYVPDDYFRLPR